MWIFGIVDTRWEPAKGYMEIVADLSRATLTAIMRRGLGGQSTIHTDMWAAYHNLPMHVPMCIDHDMVNHTFNFVNPVTGAHTQVMRIMTPYDYRLFRIVSLV